MAETIINLGNVVDDTTPQLGGALDTNAFAIDWSEATPVASAASTDIWATDGNTIHVTGTTTITDFATAPRIGAGRWVIFDAALILTDGANLNLPGGSNITTAAGDFAFIYADTTTLFQVLYFKVDGTPVVGTGISNVVEDTTPQYGGAMDTNAFALNFSEATPIASAASTNIWATDGNTIHITGTTTITDLATAPRIGASRWVIFDAALTLTDGANLNLPGGANITTAADDFALVYAETTTLFKVLYFKADGTAVVGGGGVTEWTESGNTAAPNDTVNVAAFLSAQGSTNADAALIPKGTGAVLAAVPDSGVAGGNKRGANAVDLQTTRSNASEVASATRTTIGGGGDNTASGLSATVSGGIQNEAIGNESAIGGGLANVATIGATTGVIGGGSNNSVTAISGTIGGGSDNNCDGNLAVIPGGQRAVADKHGQFAHAAGRFDEDGDAQFSRLTARNQTTNATPAELFLDGSSLRATIPSGKTWTFQGRVSVLQTGGAAGSVGDSAGIKFEGVLKNVAGTTSLVAAVTPVEIASDAALTISLAVTADDTNDSLKMEFTGEASKNLNIVCTLDITEVK